MVSQIFPGHNSQENNVGDEKLSRFHFTECLLHLPMIFRAGFWSTLAIPETATVKFGFIDAACGQLSSCHVKACHYNYTYDYVIST